MNFNRQLTSGSPHSDPHIIPREPRAEGTFNDPELSLQTNNAGNVSPDITAGTM